MGCAIIIGGILFICMIFLFFSIIFEAGVSPGMALFLALIVFGIWYALQCWNPLENKDKTENNNTQDTE